MKTSLRTHACNELTKRDKNKKVSLCGWVSKRRDHGGVIFIDLRDRYGITQIVFDPSFNKSTHDKADKLRREDCIQAQGTVKLRKKGMQNKNLKTGEIEVFINTLNIINKSAVPPIEVDDRITANEDIRLKYRYLDLRRPIMQSNLLLRHKVIKAVHEFLDKKNFIELETPLLVRSTPEGARDYIVPSRVNPGKFYALPQSPQLYKQISMVSGIDRYYQIARCLRDEDLRQDRQPEHTQIDIEMSFVTSQDIRDLVEELYRFIFKKVKNINLEKFKVLSYKESTDKYGTDKPDLRFKLELTDITQIAKDSNFSVFKDAIKNKGIVKAINPEKDFTRKELDSYIDFCIKNGAKGMAYMQFNGKKLSSNIIKYFPDNIQKELIKDIRPKKGYIFFIADKSPITNDVLSKLRIKLAQDLNLIKKEEFKFCWIIDYPLFHFNEEENKWEPEHHVFTMPQEKFLNNFDKKPEEAVGDLFDIILNGMELGSGSIRVSNPELQERILNVIGISKQEANKKFGFLLEAYKYGGPIHGGMGLGLDRLIALLAGTTDIKEVIAFPKNKAAQCPMDGSPSEIDPLQLKENHIKIDLIK